MSDIVGGQRARLIRESLYQMLRKALTDLGWFDVSRPHLPIRLESVSQLQKEEVALNTAALSDEADRETGWELGSNLTENTWQMFVDFFAENEAVGLHFIKDVRDILRGRFTTIGRNTPFFDVYDYGQATPPLVFYCELANVDIDKAHDFLKPWQQHWYACSFQVIDTYADEG